MLQLKERSQEVCIMYCIHCGHPLDEGATFCGKCGKKQIPDDKKVYSPSAPARKSLV
ncbi:MAG: zinc ribbon domain-containing protein, partial [Oscillospiraceae bacterium]|nr:zinc ribbon domain-containing protein [Oscillospiraceae bacterium]